MVFNNDKRKFQNIYFLQKGENFIIQKNYSIFRLSEKIKRLNKKDSWIEKGGESF